jgi:hypothetical protein
MAVGDGTGGGPVRLKIVFRDADRRSPLVGELHPLGQGHSRFFHLIMTLNLENSRFRGHFAGISGQLEWKKEDGRKVHAGQVRS